MTMYFELIAIQPLRTVKVEHKMCSVLFLPCFAFFSSLWTNKDQASAAETCSTPGVSHRSCTHQAVAAEICSTPDAALVKLLPHPSSCYGRTCSVPVPSQTSPRAVLDEDQEAFGYYAAMPLVSIGGICNTNARRRHIICQSSTVSVGAQLFAPKHCIMRKPTGIPMKKIVGSLPTFP